MIIDSHCHLDYEPMISNLENVISRAQENGVKYFLTISTEDKKFANILKIVKEHESVFGTYGIHPHEAKLHLNISSIDILNKIRLSKKIIGIGETGLDFYYNHSEEKDQIDLFKEHIIAAQESGLPLIVHTRSAESQTLDILKEELKKKNLKY